MANEQRLSDFTTPHINGIAAARVLSPEMLFGIAQGEICAPGRGITEGFSTDTAAAEVRIPKMRPLKQGARTLGNQINGGSFSNEQEEPQSVEYGIRIIDLLDTPIVIAQHTMDMLPVDILGTTIKNFTNVVNRNLNGMTLGYQIKSVLTDGEEANIVYFDAAADKLVDKIIEADAKLDEGDEESDIDVFPTEGRIWQVKASYKPQLFATATGGVLSLGGSNKAQEMLARGGVSPDAVVTKIENGYIGDILGAPVHIVSNIVYRVAEQYLGLPKYELDPVVATIASDCANGRGVAIGKQVKIVDAHGGQGVELQPLVRFGVEVFYPKGNAIVVKAGTENVFDVAKTLNDEYAFTRAAIKSRQAVKVTWNGLIATQTFPEGSTATKTKVCYVKKAALPKKAGLAAIDAITTTNRSAWTDGTTATVGSLGAGYPVLVTFLADGTIDLSVGPLQS